MKTHAKLAGLATLIIAFAVPSALADPSGSGITQANGADVVLPDGSVYQENADGSWSWIPNIATADAMGIDWSSLQPVSEIPGPVGDPFPAVVTVTNASVNRSSTAGGANPVPAPVSVTPANGNDVILPDGEVYQENADGTYSWIPDVSTANAMGLDWDSLVMVDSLPGPIGTPLPHVEAN